MLDKFNMWLYYHKTRLRTLWDTRGWKPGDIYEDCAYRKLKLVNISFEGDMLGETEDGQLRGCSFYHCGPEKI